MQAAHRLHGALQSHRPTGALDGHWSGHLQSVQLISVSHSAPQLTTLLCLTPQLNFATTCRCQAMSCGPDQTATQARPEARRFPADTWVPQAARHVPGGGRLCRRVCSRTEQVCPSSHALLGHSSYILLGEVKAAVLCHVSVLCHVKLLWSDCKPDLSELAVAAGLHLHTVAASLLDQSHVR